MNSTLGATRPARDSASTMATPTATATKENTTPGAHASGCARTGSSRRQQLRRGGTGWERSTETSSGRGVSRVNQANKRVTASCTTMVVDCRRSQRTNNGPGKCEEK